MPNPRLADATSPYLRQHAGDPVQWYRWDAEAFAAARNRGVPIFLSSGYSACHWCHVMQRESFRDPETAALLNERFVPVKVDRELRPDVDGLYMDYVVATTGHGGWPLSVFLDADLAPLLGGTYFPRESQSGLPTFAEVLHGVDEAFRAGGDALLAATQGSMAFLRDRAEPRPQGVLDRAAIDASADYLLRLADRAHGGLGDAPKFPQAPLQQFLCAYWRVNPDSEVAWTVGHSLTSMVRGGIYDQAGGGLFRYSVDTAWTTPHFEKMLYDNGMLLSTLARAHELAESQAVRDEYAHVARQTAAFLARELALPTGCYAASLSADQGGVEGAAYLWSHSQLAGVLDADELALAVLHLGADAADPDAPGTLTRRAGREKDAERVDAVCAKLLAARNGRPAPDLDDKLVTAWNALAVRGLLDAGAAFGDAGMTSAGMTALGVLLERCATPSGVLRVPDDPSLSEVRLIDDAALLVSACLTAHETTGSREWLDDAQRLHDWVLRTFADGTTLYMVPATTDLPVRPREEGDEPTPSGAAATIDNAARLAALTGDATYADFAREALRGFWAIADLAPEHAGRALEAALRLAT